MLGAYWRSLIHFEPERIAPWTKLCNAVGVILALGAGTFFENPSSGLVMAIGALNTGYSDGQDSYVHRETNVGDRSSLRCAVCSGGLAAENHFAAIALSTVFAFGAGMLVALGTTAAEVGMITPVTFRGGAERPVAGWRPIVLLRKAENSVSTLRPGEHRGRVHHQQPEYALGIDSGAPAGWFVISGPAACAAPCKPLPLPATKGNPAAPWPLWDLSRAWKRIPPGWSEERYL